MMRYSRQAFVALILLTTLLAGRSSGDQQPGSATGADLQGIVTGILSAWDKADLVCLGEGHGDANDADLRAALVRHPEFARRVDAIVVEFADASQQPLLDQLVVEGVNLSQERARGIWRSARGAEVWDSPMYEAFLRLVSEVNRGLPREERVRVVAGDDSSISNRGRAIRDMIRREILDKKLKALAVYGARHCERRGFGFPGELADLYPGKIWSAFGFYDAAAGRRALSLGGEPQLIPIRGTDRARVPVGQMFFTGRKDDSATLGSVIDAIVHFGDRTPKAARK